MVPAFCCVISTFVISPNERVLNSGVETERSRIDEVCNLLGKGSVKSLCANTINGENFMNSMMEVMNIDDMHMITNRTMRVPITEPRGLELN